MSDLQARIEELWADRTPISDGDPEARATVTEAIGLLDAGAARVAEVNGDGEVVVNQWLKQAILLLFSMAEMETMELGPFEYADKIPLKSDYQAAGVRVVPGASARWGSFLDRGVIMMPSYVNIGARVGANTMVDTWATVGSCAQIGANVHLSGGVGIGGVLEPPQAAPVIVGDDCLVGSRCIVAEGARLGDGVVLGGGLRAHRLDPGDRRGHRQRTGPGFGARLDRGGVGHSLSGVRRGDVRYALRAGHPPSGAGRAPRQGPAERRAARARCRDVRDCGYPQADSSGSEL